MAIRQSPQNDGQTVLVIATGSTPGAPVSIKSGISNRPAPAFVQYGAAQVSPPVPYSTYSDGVNLQTPQVVPPHQ